MPRIVSVPEGLVVNPETRKFGWIGTGVSGNGMAYQLIRQGYDVTVNDKIKGKTDNLVDHGAKFQQDVKKIAAESDYLFIDVGSEKNLENLLFDEENGIADCLKEGQIVINHSPRNIQ